MRTEAVILFLFVAISAAAQEPWTEGMLYLTGASSAEELDQSTVDAYEYLHLHPLRLNESASGRLSRLLSPYQIASLQDYRHRCGDVLSLQELALVDGFSQEKAKALAPFVSFDSARRPGEAVNDTVRVHGNTQARVDLKSMGAKVRVHAADVVEAGAAYRRYWDGRSSGGTFFVSAGSFVVGDFNLRYGQGLMLWSGMQINSFSTIDTYSRRGGGLSPSWSYSGEGTFRGFAGDYSRGAFGAMAFISETGAGGRLSATGRSGTFGLNLLASLDGAFRLSADVCRNIRGVDVFGEAGLDPLRGAWAAVGGAKLRLSDNLEAALRLGAVPSSWSGKSSGEYSLDVGIRHSGGDYCAIAGKSGFGSSERRSRLDLSARFRLLPIPLKDPRRREAKLQAGWAFRVDSLVKTDHRLVLRYRSYEPFRGELRSDVRVSNSLVCMNLRLHGVWSGGPGGLAYCEAGYTPGDWQLWLRGTVYSTSGWSSRIYVYERDVPGSFSVPACYGRGASFSVCGGWSRRFQGRYRLKVSGKGSIGIKKPDVVSAGLRLFLSFDF